MKTISIFSLKGGTGKTVSTSNIAYNLAALHGKRVLLIDCDKQGDSSRLYNRHDETLPSISDVLTEENYDITRAIRNTDYSRLDILPANMDLLIANRRILTDCMRAQQPRLHEALSTIADAYDFCLIDCAPDFTMTVINALVASDYIAIPLKVDRFIFDGMPQLLKQLQTVRAFNPGLKILGTFLTMYYRSGVTEQGEDYIRSVQSKFNLPVLRTIIRRTTKVDQSTFAGPLLTYAPKSTAAQDYIALTKEILELC